MSVDISLARSLEQILRLELMKRPFDVFDTEGEETTSKSLQTRAKKVPANSVELKPIDAAHTYKMHAQRLIT